MENLNEPLLISITGPLLAAIIGTFPGTPGSWPAIIAGPYGYSRGLLTLGYRETA